MMRTLEYKKSLFFFMKTIPEFYCYVTIFTNLRILISTILLRNPHDTFHRPSNTACTESLDASFS